MAHTVPIPAIGTPRAAWRLLKPFWLSKKNWYAWPIIAAMFALATLTTYVQVVAAKWTNQFMTTFVEKDLAAFPKTIMMFMVIAFAMAFVSILSTALMQGLEIFWRTGMTKRLLDRWLSDNAFYRIERDRLFDNPDQRIAEDTQLFISTSLLLTVGLWGTLTQVATFSYMVWTVGGGLEVGGIVIPGYLFWCALLWVSIQTGLGHLAGRALMPLTYRRQQVEGDFRYSMASVRRSSEEIAIYGGADTEHGRLLGYFDNVRRTLWKLLYVEMRFKTVMNFIEQLMTPLPLFLMAPQYFANKMTFGEMAQTGQLFGQLTSALLWFVRNYQSLQTFRVVVARLYAFEELYKQATENPSGFEYRRDADNAIEADALTLRTPDGRVVAANVSLDVGAGQRWLLRGRSGAGKSTLLRTLAGIWPYGSGKIQLPRNADCLFMSQRSYLPLGTLKEQLCYPHTPESYGDDACRHALDLASLPQLADQLYEVQRWGDRLSQGEQQRLAMARAMLQKPAFLFMDEATSALDEDTETLVYGNLLRELDKSAIVHIAHHSSLQKFHDQTLVIEGAQNDPKPTSGRAPALVS